MKDLKEFKPLLRFIKDEKLILIIGSILIFIAQFLEIFTGYLNGAAVESITKLELKKAIIYLVIYLILRLIVELICRINGSALLQKVEIKISSKLGLTAYMKALDLPAYAYEEKTSGEIINRVTNDTVTLSNTFEQLLNVISSLIGSFIILIYIFMNSIIIGIEIIVFVTMLFCIIKKYYPKFKDLQKKTKKEKDKFTSLTTESIRGIREIKTLGIKNNLIYNVKYIIKNILKKSNNQIELWKKYNMLTRLLKSLLEVGVFITCVILLYYGKITLTFFIAMTYYVYRYMWLIENINGFTSMYQQLIVSITRVNEIIENRLYKDEKFGDISLKNVKGVIEFKNVSFAYPNESNTLNKFNLVIEPNKKIAIVGKSGQGKSTLFNLITRIFDVDKGKILLDGIDIKDLKEKDLRKNISIIRQEPFIFNRTIKENFKLVDSKITLSEIRKYTKLAYLDDYIMSLPKGYNTKLGEGGVNLSGGQKQRLAIARTLAKKSKVILFDEATSALDNNSQKFIKKAIDNLVKDHTIIIVAHRLSTIMDADIIYVVDKGKIADSGTHKDLLKTNKIYKSLYETESID